MSITVTVTSARHIAAATAAYQATIPAQPEPPEPPIPGPYADVRDYVQQALNRVAESWADQTGIDSIPVWRFVRRFTNQEFDAITAAGESDANVAQILDKLNTVAGGVVRLGSETMVQAMGYLVGVGLLTQARADQITAYGPDGVIGGAEEVKG